MKKLLWTTIASFVFAGFAFSADCDKCKKTDGAEAKKEEGTVAEGKCKKKCDKEEEKEEGTLIAGKCKKECDKEEAKKEEGTLAHCGKCGKDGKHKDGEKKDGEEAKKEGTVLA